MDSSNEVAVEAAGLGKRFGSTRALRPIDFCIRNGELVGLIGASGSGKTTLCRLLYGALRPSEGTAVVLGKDLGSISPRGLRDLRRSVGVVPQTHGLVPSLTAAQNVATGLAGRRSVLGTLRLLWMHEDAGREAVYRALSRVGIEGLIDRRVDQLSGGQQQRVAVARALAQDPVLLIADEPVASVDAGTARMVMEVLSSFAGAGGAALVSLHQPGLAAAYCGRSIELDAPAAAIA